MEKIVSAPAGCPKSLQNQWFLIVFPALAGVWLVLCDLLRFCRATGIALAVVAALRPPQSMGISLRGAGD